MPAVLKSRARLRMGLEVEDGSFSYHHYVVASDYYSLLPECVQLGEGSARSLWFEGLGMKVSI